MLVGLAAQSAAEVMTRQRRRRDPSRLTWLRVQHHSCGGFNGWWRRLPYDHAGRPVFAQGGRYFYFRPGSSDAPRNEDEEQGSSGGGRGGGAASMPSPELRLPGAAHGLVRSSASNCWVIDVSIRAQGLPLSGSLSPRLDGPWASPDEAHRDRRRNASQLRSAAETGGAAGGGGTPPRVALRIHASPVGARGFATVALTWGDVDRLPAGLKVTGRCSGSQTTVPCFILSRSLHVLISLVL
jgi:hypothetical protein